MAMRVVGWIVLIVGCLLMINACTQDTSVATGDGKRVHNIGLMRDQENHLITGAVLAVIGSLFLIASRRRSDAISPAADLVTCPHCAEQIKAAARVCKHCGRDVEGPAPLAPAPAPHRGAGDMPTQEDLMRELKIVRQRGVYCVGTSHFRHLDDAIDFAQSLRR